MPLAFPGQTGVTDAEKVKRDVEMFDRSEEDDHESLFGVDDLESLFGEEDNDIAASPVDSSTSGEDKETAQAVKPTTGLALPRMSTKAAAAVCPVERSTSGQIQETRKPAIPQVSTPIAASARPVDSSTGGAAQETSCASPDSIIDEDRSTTPPPRAPVKRGRGRPKGSKNRPKPANQVNSEAKVKTKKPMNGRHVWEKEWEWERWVSQPHSVESCFIPDDHCCNLVDQLNALLSGPIIIDEDCMVPSNVTAHDLNEVSKEILTWTMPRLDEEREIPYLGVPAASCPPLSFWNPSAAKPRNGAALFVRPSDGSDCFKVPPQVARDAETRRSQQMNRKKVFNRFEGWKQLAAKRAAHQAEIARIVAVANRKHAEMYRVAMEEEVPDTAPTELEKTFKRASRKGKKTTEQDRVRSGRTTKPPAAEKREAAKKKREQKKKKKSRALEGALETAFEVARAEKVEDSAISDMDLEMGDAAEGDLATEPVKATAGDSYDGTTSENEMEMDDDFEDQEVHEAAWTEAEFVAELQAILDGKGEDEEGEADEAAAGEDLVAQLQAEFDNGGQAEEIEDQEMEFADDQSDLPVAEPASPCSSVWSEEE